MSFPFSCPHCELETLVDDDFAGQTGPCAACGKSITVPFLNADQGLADDEVVVGIASRGRKSTFTIVTIVVAAMVSGIMVVGTLMALLFPAVGAVRSAAHRHSCDTNLERIGHALQAYEAEHGTLPPAYIPDENGRPMHSWRVLILPYLDEHTLYSSYDFNQPWDSPQNQALVRKMPSVFACPADPDAKNAFETSYLVVRGAGTMFPGAKPVGTRQAGDELTTTILVAEAPVSGISWLDPRDLFQAEMQFVVNGGFGTEIGSHHEGGANVLMADGMVRFLRDTTAADLIQGMTTASGQEPIPFEVLNDGTDDY